MKLLLWLGGAIAVLGLLAPRLQFSGKPIPFATVPEVRSLVEGNSAFAVDLYRQLAGQPGNLFFSPHGISTSLAMAYAGARGQTAKEMAAALHFQLPQASLPPAFGELAGRMDRIQRWPRISLTSASSLWLQQDYDFTDDFLNQIRTAYRAEAQRVDFKRNPQDASARINRWAAKATGGKMENASRADQFPPDTRLLLCNAIHFKGTWKDRFEPGQTSTGPFHVTTNTSVPVPLMHRLGRFKTTFSDDYRITIVELPYSGGDLSMVILLPETSDYPTATARFSIRAMEEGLSWESLKGYLRNLEETDLHETDLVMPRFTIRQRHNLVPALKAAGLASMFDGRADFSGMDGTTKLFVADVTHEALVEVDETGTEAAAFTLFRAAARGGPTRVRLDHPFMFLIRDRASGSILFLGRVVDPSK
ncbi:MAG TPA: serpin family protein [Candidatus Limnocylindria bacterium]|jgi:serpin B|nr:serpin family protein [Candidatus Limnocylindria bacterium]